MALEERVVVVVVEGLERIGGHWEGEGNLMVLGDVGKCVSESVGMGGMVECKDKERVKRLEFKSSSRGIQGRILIGSVRVRQYANIPFSISLIINNKENKNFLAIRTN